MTGSNRMRADWVKAPNAIGGLLILAAWLALQWYERFGKPHKDETQKLFQDADNAKHAARH